MPNQYLVFRNENFVELNGAAARCANQHIAFHTAREVTAAKRTKLYVSRWVPILKEFL
jgi:hypothetical protein